MAELRTKPHNPARSQMAEAFLREIGGVCFAAASAGLEAGCLNPLVLKEMSEIGLDISAQSTDDIKSVIQRGDRFDYVITVCYTASAQRCPIVPGTTQTLHWSLENPAALSGNDEEKMGSGARDSGTDQGAGLYLCPRFRHSSCSIAD